MHDVELRGVTKQFGETFAVRDADLCIEKGSFFSLLGPSGSGKTTILRLIAGFEEPTSGEIFIQGTSVERQPAHLRQVNTVFQNYALFPHLDVYENVAFGLRRRGQNGSLLKERVAEALRLVHLEGFERRRPQQMSGGEQQRVAMARALINRPPVLLLDEPLSALDEKLRKQMQGELKRIQRELGITFILVTHDQEEALTLSDRLAVMNKGRVEQTGTPAEIYENPATRFVTDFIGATNFLQGHVVEVPNGMAVVDLGRDRRITLPWHDGVPQQKSLEFFVRPERMWLTLTPPEKNGVNVLSGRLLDTIYQGAVTRYRVELGSQEEVLVSAQNSDGSVLSAEPGQTVYVQWNPQSTRLVRQNNKES